MSGRQMKMHKQHRSEIKEVKEERAQGICRRGRAGLHQSPEIQWRQKRLRLQKRQHRIGLLQRCFACGGQGLARESKRWKRRRAQVYGSLEAEEGWSIAQILLKVNKTRAMIYGKTDSPSESSYRFLPRSSDIPMATTNPKVAPTIR